MMAISQRTATLSEFLTLAETKPPLELIDGRIRQKVSPQGKHSALQGELVELFNNLARSSRLARAFPKLRTTFGGSSPVPDVCVYSWDRIPVDDDGDVANRFTEPPDIAAEIISPDQRARSQTERCLWYVTNGVRAALLVDPDQKSIIVFRTDGSSPALRGSDRIDLEDLFSGFSFTIDEVFDGLKLR